MNKNIITTIIVALIVGALGFYGGMQYQKSRPGSQFAQFGGGNFGNGNFGPGQNPGRGQGQFRTFGNGQNNGRVIGEILNMDDKSLTVKMKDGSSKIVIFSDSTAINKEASGSKNDLKNGERIAVFGTINSDGSVTAQNIQLNPNIRGPGGPNDSTPSSTPPTQ